MIRTFKTIEHFAAIFALVICSACGAAGSAQTKTASLDARDPSGASAVRDEGRWVVEDITLETQTDDEAERADAAVLARRQRTHSRLPELVKTGDGGRADAWPVVEISNKADYTLVVWFSGPCSRVITIQPQGKQNAELCAGRYEVAAELAAPHFLPFVGSGELLENGHNYALTFFILRHPKEVVRKAS